MYCVLSRFFFDSGVTYLIFPIHKIYVKVLFFLEKQNSKSNPDIRNHYRKTSHFTLPKIFEFRTDFKRHQQLGTNFLANNFCLLWFSMISRIFFELCFCSEELNWMKLSCRELLFWLFSNQKIEKLISNWRFQKKKVVVYRFSGQMKSAQFFKRLRDFKWKHAFKQNWTE